jgi:glutaredoxin
MLYAIDEYHSTPPTAEKPAASKIGPQFMPVSPAKVLLYTRAGCHLCDDAKAVLESFAARFALEIESIDIDADPGLVARYNECVPVVAIDGRERFRGRVDPLLLRRLLKGRRDEP